MEKSQTHVGSVTIHRKTHSGEKSNACRRQCDYSSYPVTRNDEGEGRGVRIWPASDGCRKVYLVLMYVK